MSKSVTATCPTCNQQFVYYPSTFHGKAKQYCSRACRTADKRITTQCPQCGKDFSYHKSWPRIYCSRKCSAKANIHRQLGVVELAPIHCENCGAYIERPLDSERRFCSMKCFGEWNSKHKVGPNHPAYTRLSRVCEHCGKEFVAAKSEVAKGWGRFCSQKCRSEHQKITLCGENNPHWKGGIEPYYGPNWPGQRRNARRRDKYTCQRCGKTEAELGKTLDVHHVVPIRLFADFSEANKLSNLVSLCRSCHPIVEAHGLN